MPKHGESKRCGRTRLYDCWRGICSRCKDKSNPNYGGRGITVCEEWQEYIPFRDWARANGYADDLQIDRIDNDGNYEPGNCRFVTPKENANNRRERSDTVYDAGESLASISRNTGIKIKTLCERYRMGDRAHRLRRPLDYPIRDEGQTLQEIADEIGLTLTGVTRRYQNGDRGKMLRRPRYG